MELFNIYESLGLSRAVFDRGEAVLAGLADRFRAIDRTAEYNQAKVLSSMQKNRVGANHFAATTGYGYDDDGRERLERVYAGVFHTEAALVRPQITCGTHALTVALSANLLPGDELLSPVGLPYDTLQEVIGIRPSPCSLAEYGVTYRQADLKSDGSFDYDAIRAAITPKTKLITIQRSKGYATRPSFSVEQIGELIAFCKNIKPDVLVMVDNCYGEFVDTVEPSDVGADMTVGSLIKNPGGGLAPIGGYICGGGSQSGHPPRLLPGLFPGPHGGGRGAEGRDLRRPPLRGPGLSVRALRRRGPVRHHPGCGAGQRGGYAGLLRRHPGSCAGGQLRRSRARGHARLRQPGDHGGGHLRPGQQH